MNIFLCTQVRNLLSDLLDIPNFLGVLFFRGQKFVGASHWCFLGQWPLNSEVGRG